jgi:capsular exopolysaccharide synthesis family protein
MSESLTPFDPRQPHALGAPRDNVPRGLAAGRAGASQEQYADDQGSIPWARYIAALKRSWWIIVLAVGAGGAAGVYLASLQPVTYIAEARILLIPSSVAGPIGTPQILRTSQWVQLLRSNVVVDPVVRELKLNAWFGPDSYELSDYLTLDTTFEVGRYRLSVDSAGLGYTLTRLGTGELETGFVGDSIGRQWGLLWAPPASLLPAARVVEFNVLTVRDASRSLIGRITATLPGDEAQFMNLRFPDANRERAARILNAWIDQFINAASDLKLARVVETRAIVDEQLGIAAQSLVRAENALTAFRRTAVGRPMSMAEGSPGMTLVEQRISLEELERNRGKIEAILRAPPGSMTPESFYVMPAVLSESPSLRNALNELEQLLALKRAKLSFMTEANPAIDSLTQAITRLERETIPRVLRGLAQSHLVRESEIRAGLSTRSAELRQIPDRALDEMRFARDVALAEDIYGRLKQKSEELKLASAEMTVDLQRLDVAEPPRAPERTDAVRLLLMALVGSLGAGVGIALMRDRIDRRFRYPEQATMDLGLTIAGTVPKLRFDRKKQLGVTALSQVVESFRAMRLAVRHQFPTGQPIVLCVSSPGPEEGKSLVSANLAVAFANAGHATLLIDGDVRRGVVHTTFDAPRRPGLVDYLAGGASADSVIRATATPNLSIIPSGSRLKNAPELLVSDRMNALVSAMREQFEVVIVDSAPFAAGMDAFALGAAAGTMLVVLRPGVTDRKLAAMKLEVLDRLPVAVLGAVVNGIAADSAYRYYYSDYGYADPREWAIDDEGEVATAGRVADGADQRLIARK